MREPAEHAAVRWIAIAAILATAFVLWPFAPWILFAIWASALVRPFHARLSRRLGERPRLGAAAATIALVVVAAPFVVLLASLADDAIALVRRVIATDQVQSLLARQRDGADSKDLAGLAISEGGRAWSFAQQLAGTTARVAIGLVIAIGGVYAVLVDGGRWYAWLEAHAPMSAASFRRFAGAIVETGRGLFFGIVGAGFAQAVVATIFYVALGVPQPFAFGMLTLLCSIIPAIGTAIVWLPVTVALALTGRETAAVVLACGGVFVIGTIDNVVRPYLARRGRLQLPTFVVALAMFGGVASMGARGVILGPLIVRLAKEALVIWRETTTASVEQISQPRTDEASASHVDDASPAMRHRRSEEVQR